MRTDVSISSSWSSKASAITWMGYAPGSIWSSNTMATAARSRFTVAVHKEFLGWLRPFRIQLACPPLEASSRCCCLEAYHGHPHTIQPTIRLRSRVSDPLRVDHLSARERKWDIYLYTGFCLVKMQIVGEAIADLDGEAINP